MRIAASNVNLSSNRNYQKYGAVYERVGFGQNLMNLSGNAAVSQRDIYESRTEMCTDYNALNQGNGYSDINHVLELSALTGRTHQTDRP